MLSFLVSLKVLLKSCFCWALNHFNSLNQVKSQDIDSLDTITIVKIDQTTIPITTDNLDLPLDLSQLDQTPQRDLLTTITTTTTKITPMEITIETIEITDRTTDKTTRETNLNSNSRITITELLLFSQSLLKLASSSLARLDRLWLVK